MKGFTTKICDFLCIHNFIVEVFFLLEYDARSLENWFLEVWRPLLYLETLGSNYPTTRNHISEERTQVNILYALLICSLVLPLIFSSTIHAPNNFRGRLQSIKLHFM